MKKIFDFKNAFKEIGIMKIKSVLILIVLFFSITGCTTNNIEKYDANNGFPRLIKVSTTTDIYDDVILVSVNGEGDKEVKLMVSNTECYFEFYENNVFKRRLKTDCTVNRSGEIEASTKSPWGN